jgi:hypothetical protein
VREALDQPSARIGQRFRDQPLVEAAIRTTIGRSYNRLDQQRLAMPHLERAVALRRLHLGSYEPDTVSSMVALCDSYVWLARYTDAIALRVDLVDARTAALGPDHTRTIEYLRILADYYGMARQYDTGIRLLEQLLEKQCAIYGPTHQDTLRTTHCLASNYYRVGRYAESTALHEKIVEALKRNVT